MPKSTPKKTSIKKTVKGFHKQYRKLNRSFGKLRAAMEQLQGEADHAERPRGK